MNRTTLGVVGASTLMAATVALVGCGGGTTDLQVTVRNHSRAVLDLAAKGASPDDVLTVNGDILGADGSVVGDFELSSLVTRVARGQESRSTTAHLVWSGSDDSLVFSGVPRYPAGGGLPNAPVLFAVIGGTGQYAGAGGQATVTLTKDKTFNWQIQLAN